MGSPGKSLFPQRLGLQRPAVEHWSAALQRAPAEWCGASPTLRPDLVLGQTGVTGLLARAEWQEGSLLRCSIRENQRHKAEAGPVLDGLPGKELDLTSIRVVVGHRS